MTAPAETPPITARVEEKFPGAVTASHQQFGDETITVAKDQYLAVMTLLRNDPTLKFNLMVDLSAVDFLGQSPRFQVVVHLKSLSLGHRLRVKVGVGEDGPEACTLPTISKLWVAADWYERECFDMYGIRFQGHPNLKRLLLYESFVGHPLRKDYDIHLQQPRVELRPVRERYDYQNRNLTDPSETERRPL
ncbi:MAG: NADH-quinone oxidoreductase subunit C [Deltaproteobacteria bacterium]|nr:NADH-quinone oxidoreductase subunit C [Deltaproteobacteria bacterium]MDH4122020.1 NADH-quinone oxidoreductase subunit C [Deltaproteobacteria bacterium]